jgi:hypothetical protein
MRPLGTAFALILAALAVPTASLAQSAHDTPFVQPVRPIRPPVRRRPPVKPRPPVHGPGQNSRYTIVIDGSVVDRYLATPAPRPSPKPTRKPTPRPKGAPDVFETHSTGNE